MSKRPGKIIKEFNVDFTNTLFDNECRKIEYEDKYFKVKDEIMGLINSQIEN